MRRWRSGASLDSGARTGRDDRSPRSMLLALVLTCVTLMTLDLHHDTGSPVDPARAVVGGALGPVEGVVGSAMRPVDAVPAWFRSRSALRHDVAALRAENSELRQQVATSGVDRNRLAEYDGLTAAARTSGHALLPAHVVALGASQTFTRTVTIDAGSRAGVRPDQTVLNADGLVGRVLRVTATTATVLLVVDGRSVVGGRVGSTMEVGFLSGRGVTGEGARLDLELVDDAVVPAQGDVVVTWGSRGGAPYVSGVPVGRVTQVFASLRDSSRRAVIEPYVDFTALDLVGVVVPSGTHSDRSIVEADGSLR